MKFENASEAYKNAEPHYNAFLQATDPAEKKYHADIFVDMIDEDFEPNMQKELFIESITLPFIELYQDIKTLLKRIFS